MANKQLASLDLVRGIAIILVVLYHTYILLFPVPDASSVYNESGFLILDNIKTLFYYFNPLNMGWTGVELFLVLSGFLIQYNYAPRYPNISWKRFFAKRLFRIIPAYYAALLIFFTFYGIRTGSLDWNDFIIHSLFLHNLFDAYFFTVNASFWSIALEMQLYFLFPLVIYGFFQFSLFKSWVASLFLHISFSIVAFFYSIESESFLTNVFAYWFVWVSGAFLAQLYLKDKVKMKPRVSLLFSLLFVAVFYLVQAYEPASHFKIIPITICYMFLMVFFIGVKKWSHDINFSLPFKILAMTGTISYSLYLFHQPFLPYLLKFFNPGTSWIYINQVISAIISFTVIWAFSYLSYIGIEKKGVKWGNAFIYKKPKSILKG